MAAFVWVNAFELMAAASKLFSRENLTVKSEDWAQFNGGEAVRVRLHGHSAVRVSRSRLR